jgi:Zinc carboxypeptidase
MTESVAHGRRAILVSFVLLAAIALALIGLGAVATSPAQAQEAWEYTNGNYDMIYYSEIPGYLAGLEMSPRVRVTQIGTSAGGRPLYQLVITEPSAHGKYGKYQMLRTTMMRDPAKAQRMIAKDPDYKVPFFINSSIHGFETTGVDAGIRVAQMLAFENTAEVRTILANTIVVINVVANPDGRIDGWRQNANGFDCNRDMITLSQPEARAIAKIYTTWKPMVSVDNHGFVMPILIEPCSMPHNPNYEGDLYLDWMLQQAEAQEARLQAEVGEDFPYAEIPYRDYEAAGGWDDYAPIYIPMFGLYYGISGQTVETGPRDLRGVDGHFWSTWAALLFASENREGMFHDQLEVFRRGTNFGGPEGGEFPYAHIIPMGSGQLNQTEAARTVNQLLGYDIEVKVATKAFRYGGVTYPAGSYVVPLDQPLAGLANTLLSRGEDLTYDPGIPMYDIAAVNYPELWGFTRVVAEEPFNANLRATVKATFPAGAVSGSAGRYMLVNEANDAIFAVNRLLAMGHGVAQLQEDAGRWDAGDFYVTAPAQAVRDLARSRHLTFTGVTSAPGAELKELAPVKIAAFTRRNDLRAIPADPGAPNVPPRPPGVNYGNSGTAGNATVGPTVFVLEKLGFDVDIVREADIIAGALDDYDVIVTSESAPGGAASAARPLVSQYLLGDGAFVAFGSGGASFARTFGYLASFEALDSDSESNGISHVTFARDNPITGCYPENDYVFDYFPAYFTDTAGLEVLATYPDDAFLAGFMPGYEALYGTAAAVRNGDGVVFGNEPVFRAHIKNGFRLLANAIYSVDE